MSDSDQISQIKKIFDEASKELKATVWFKEGKWVTSTHLFPATNPEAMTFHVFKPHWYNADRQGIHIESFLNIDEKKRKKSSVTIHLLHHDLVPGTKIKRAEIARFVVDAVYDEISEWDGYAFRAGNYGLQPFTRHLDGHALTYKNILVKEITKLCKTIGPVVDKAIKEIVQ